LSAAQRPANVDHAFAVARRQSSGAARLFGRRLEAVTVVLIDDVMTTGATIEACSRVLKDAGAARVRALTVGRAVRLPRQPLPAPPHLSPARRQ
jgi:predicted amidophosphoribosyltransferase